MEKPAEILKNNDVVNVSKEIANAIGSTTTFKVEEYFLTKLFQSVSQPGKDVLLQGVESEILRCDGKGWRKGKFNISVTFIPDEPQSPLDDLRQQNL